jgi:hypothetical protein
MIGDATHNFRNTVHAANNATKIGMQTRAPVSVDLWSSLLCREYDVVMKTEEG